MSLPGHTDCVQTEVQLAAARLRPFCLLPL